MTLPASGSIRTLAITPNAKLLEINFTTQHTTVYNHRKWKKTKEE